MPTTEKNKIWSLLGDCAPAFALYCSEKATTSSKTIAYMFENSPGFDLNAPMVQNMLLPQLLMDGVIDYDCIDRIYNYTGADIPPHLQRPTPTPTLTQNASPTPTPTPTVTPSPTS